jgi:hypothetical protein
MKAKFEICMDEQRDLSAFDYGLKSLMVELGGGSFQRSEGPASHDAVYDYECANGNAQLTINSVNALVARHHLIEYMQKHELLSE